MAKQMDNSYVAFERPASVMPHVVLGVSVCVVLLVGGAVAVYYGTFVLAAVFAASFLGVAGYSWFVNDRIKRLTAAKGEKLIDWESALPDIQRQSLNIEVNELSRILEVDTEQISDLQSAYIVAEDLALRQIQQEENVPLLRHVSVSGVPFDAVFVKGEIVVCCEVSFLIIPELRQERVEAMMRKIARVKLELDRMNVGMDVRLMSILITQLTPEDEDHLRRTLGTKRFSETPVDIDIRLLDFEALQRIYVTD
ncbi:hypothetical protein BH24ACI3_BH24ACI3_11810 [soil metagenome]